MIEDNPTNLELMVYILSACKHEVLEAHEGIAGLQKARTELPDLILLDIHMPRMDGYEVARRLRADQQCSHIPLVAVTALAMVGDREKIVATGFNGYIAKPIEAESFISQVNQFLSVPQQSVPTAIKPSAQESKGGTSPVRKRAVILFVDNTQTNIDLIRSTLEPTGYEVVTAMSAKEGLDLARRMNPDLILSDVHMPHEDGYSFMRMVQGDSVLRYIPFVFLTASVWSKREKIQALQQGASKFLTRPIEPQALLEEIEGCLKKQSR
ncbi:MAG TPA: response regulator [Candidatus Acidoferrales bacterium]|nr:response regulator [Candidatus Acidoferrales bacterium]